MHRGYSRGYAVDSMCPMDQPLLESNHGDSHGANGTWGGDNWAGKCESMRSGSIRGQRICYMVRDAVSSTNEAEDLWQFDSLDDRGNWMWTAVYGESAALLWRAA